MEERCEKTDSYHPGWQKITEQKVNMRTQHFLIFKGMLYTDELCKNVLSITLLCLKNKNERKERKSKKAKQLATFHKNTFSFTFVYALSNK